MSESQSSQADDRMIRLAEEYSLVGSMFLQMDAAPSVCLGSLVRAKNLNDMAAAVQAAVKTAEALFCLFWTGTMCLEWPSVVDLWHWWHSTLSLMVTVPRLMLF
jgi:hypothetical protein